MAKKARDIMEKDVEFVSADDTVADAAKKMTVRELADQPEVVTIGADDSIDEALRTMKDKKVRRLPVIDGRQVVGIISQGDLATNLPEDKVGDLVEAISAAP